MARARNRLTAFDLCVSGPVPDVFVQHHRGPLP